MVDVSMTTSRSAMSPTSGAASGALVAAVVGADGSAVPGIPAAGAEAVAVPGDAVFPARVVAATGAFFTGFGGGNTAW